MSNIVLAITCLLLGKLLQNVKQFPESSSQVLNSYVIYVALPALILVQISKLTLDAHLLAPVLVAWLVMGASAGVTWLLARRCRWTPPVTGALLLVITLGNTSFIGFPLIEAHLGTEALPYAILYDQLGTFLALNTLGIVIANHYSPIEHTQPEPLWRKILKFPPFGALLGGFVLGQIEIPGTINTVLQRMADTLVPVVMVAVGLQWRLRIERNEYRLIVFALVFILIGKPAQAWVLVNLMHLDPLVAKTTILTSAMPAMISTGALAIIYQLAPRLVSTIIGYSLMLSFLTVWLWSLII
jgi:malate permease and related proteins